VQRRFLTLFNVASNFVGVPLALAFTILAGVNGVVTLLLVRSGLVQDFNIYSLQGLMLIYPRDHALTLEPVIARAVTTHRRWTASQ